MVARRAAAARNPEYFVFITNVSLPDHNIWKRGASHVINKVIPKLVMGLCGLVGIAALAAGPKTADGHPDLNGYWKGTRDTVPGGNIAKDLPGLKLPLTPAGEAAWKHNTTATIDPESLCIIGGIPRHNASGLPFEIVQGTKKIVFLRS